MKLLFAVVASLAIIISLSSAEPSDKYSPKVFPETLDAAALPPHPRLILKDAELPLVKALIEQDPKISSRYSKLEEWAEDLLKEPTIHRGNNGEENLDEARRSINIITTLAGLYRLDSDVRKLERVKKELAAVASLDEWFTENFLATAELSFGVAIGYDWLYPSLSPEERKTIRQALIDKALLPGRQRLMSNFKWVKITTNWNPVCNGGLSIGALAIAEDEPRLSAEILDRALESIKIAMPKYAPDGGDPEGPMYWVYGTRYNVYLIDGLMTTFGTDYGLKAIPGFSLTGRYFMATNDPAGEHANTSDAEEGRSNAPQLFWFAREYKERAYYDYELGKGPRRGTIFHLFWAIKQPTSTATPLDPNQCFRAINIASFRDNWTDTTASFLLFKGGSNLANHTHLDLGTFILNAKGVRWGIDLGPDDYLLPGYNGRDPRRWTYFRISTGSHNTLILDGENQNLQAEAKIIKFQSSPTLAFAVMDLSSTYPEKVASMQRGIRKIGSNFLIQDELDLKKSTHVTWNFVTRAAIELTETGARLSQHNAQIHLRILEPAGAKFVIASAAQKPPENENKGVQMLQLHLPEATGKTRIVIVAEATKLEPTDLEVTPLASWQPSQLNSQPRESDQ